MVTDKLRVSDYNERHYTVTINASWVTIKDDRTGKTVVREPQNGDWYDAEHKAFVDALRELERATFALFDKG